ncbi:protein EXECUTER 2, chloroplastic isoform X2 [Diospyros lotus]|uniref:protein EXECUTER 2, chloroplastic isoform X2 n=1 Tax=Diospyros lotus TaxID=55363 RepID=UPI00224F88DD|nr:protein EXECUTER 2, chloroplastic isoform X2 [Diospyros lotus]
MAVANVWGTVNSISLPQLRPLSSSSSSSSSAPYSYCSHCYLKKSANATLVLSRDRASPIRKQLLKSRESPRVSCRCSAANSYENSGGDNSSSSSSEWDWNRWTRHFSQIEQSESFASVLKNAIEDERYHDASQLCRHTGSGLVGWWVGFSKDSDDPFGRLIRITPGVGRFIGRSYSPRQLVTASPGTPLFEIFVVKDADETYTMQVVFLQQAKGSSPSTTSLSSNSKSPEGPSSSEIDDASVVDTNRSETKAEKSEDKSINVEGATEEGISSVINYLKEKIPELKLKVMNINVTEEVIEDTDAVNQFKQEDNESMSGEDSGDEASNLDDSQPDQVAPGESDDATEDGKNLDMKVFIGGILHNKEDTSTKDEYVRVPADIKDMERDSFVLRIPTRSEDCESEETVVPKVKVATIAAKGVSELMPPDVAKAFLGTDKVSSKVSRDMREIIKFAVSQAQKRDRLSEYTTFSRITSSEGNVDPFEGLYVGAFGPYGTEVVQLRRKYGSWNRKDDTDESSEVEFFEYVEAVKLTGDLNVPAGQVTFRAKIGKGNRISNRGLYPDELGVVASYKGQGRIAEFGFRNPKWVDGELLQLNGKGIGPYVRGADLGFLYVVPEQSFLVLFNRLKLPD